MININNKRALDSISEHPFPSSRIDMRLEEILWLINRASSSLLSPEAILELASKIKLMTEQITELTEEWKEKV